MNESLIHKANMRGFYPEKIVKDFKGRLYIIICIAEHSETGEPLMIYRELTKYKNCARPLEMFLSKVDKEKYPNAEQEYRFEVVCDE